MAQPVNYNVYAPGSRGQLQVEIDGTWYRLPKVRNVGFTATTPTDTTTEYVDEPTETRSGSSGPGNVTYDLTRAPTTLAYRAVYEAFKSGTTESFRDFGGSPTSFANPSTATSNTIAIAAPTNTTDKTTTATLAGTLSAGSATAPSNMFRPGKVIEISRVAYTIEAITGDKTLTVSRLGRASSVSGISSIVNPDDEALAVVAASNAWAVREPGTMREFSGRVTEMGAYSRSAANEGQVDRMVVNVLAFPDDQIVLAV